MPRFKERLWKVEEIIGMGETISRLRQMRSAAVMKNPTMSVRIKKVLLGWAGSQEPIYLQQETLAHAEQLADATGDFFAAKISKTGHRKNEYRKWQDVLSDSKKKYRLYFPTTYSKTGLEEVVGRSILGRFRNMHIDPKYQLYWDFFENNKLGVSIDDLQDMGIISPLSGDYLIASFYSSYLRRTRGKSFDTHTAALSKDLSVVVLPLADGKYPFEDKSKIGIYIDTTETGNTARALLKKVQECYPEKTILPPKKESTEFTASKKIEEYWASYYH